MRLMVSVVMLLVSCGLATRGLFRQPFLTWDESNYARLGLPPEVRQHPFQGVSLSYQGAKPAAVVTVSVGYLLFGITPWAPVIISLWIGSVLLAVVFQWARRASGNYVAGWLSIALLGSSFSLNWYSRLRSPQNAQMLFLAVAGLCLVQWERTGSRHWIQRAGISAGVAVLYHYLSVYAAIAMCVWILTATYRNTHGEKQLGSRSVRLANLMNFLMWSAMPLIVAMALSAYRPPGSDGEGRLPVRYYYAETLWWQTHELGGGENPDLLYYPRTLFYYEGVSAAVLLGLVGGYHLLRIRSNRRRIGLLTNLVYLPAAVLIASSALGSDMRPRALAIILPVLTVYLGCGLNNVLKRVCGTHQLSSMVVVILVMLVLGVNKGASLFRLTHPYYDIRDYVVDNHVTSLAVWRPNDPGLRPNEWEFMQRDTLTLQEMVWLEQLEEVKATCEANSDTVLLVGGGTLAPNLPGMTLTAQFDNNIDLYIPTLLEEGHNLKPDMLSPRMIKMPNNGVRLYKFRHCRAID